VDGYLIPRPTAKDGSFHYLVDNTTARRHLARIARLAHATVSGRPLTSSQQSSLSTAVGGFSVGYPIDNLHASVRPNGTVLVTGRLRGPRGNGVPTVALYTYQLAGTITDADGKPVQGAIVITRTQDRDFWRFSSPSDANGHYISFLSASDETAADPSRSASVSRTGRRPTAATSGRWPTSRGSRTRRSTSRSARAPSTSWRSRAPIRGRSTKDWSWAPRAKAA